MPSFSSDERQLLQDSLQDYFSNKYSFEHFRTLSQPQHSDGYGKSEWKEYAELGWLGVSMPESAGGSAAGMTELGIIMAAAGGALALEPLIGTAVLGAGALEKAGTADQQQLLSKIVLGEHTLAFCHSEPDAGYARNYVTTVATEAGDNYVLNGGKSFALHADSADSLIVSARLGSSDGPLSLFLVPTETQGVEQIAAPALDMRRGAAVSLKNASVPKSARLGTGDNDMTAVVDDIIDRGVLAVCAEAAGAMAAVTEQTVEYLKTREQFGQPLSKFQVLQHRLVDMNISTEESRAATHGALKAYDDGAPDAQAKVWKAKVQMAKSARYVGGQAIQLHGGMGMTDELAIGHYYKRLTMCETLFGDADWYLRQLSTHG